MFQKSFGTQRRLFWPLLGLAGCLALITAGSQAQTGSSPGKKPPSKSQTPPGKKPPPSDKNPTPPAPRQPHYYLKITKAPKKGSGGPDETDKLVGKAGGDIQDCKMVLYTLAGGVWYIQPRTDAPDTVIKPDRTFSADVHLGVQYAAILVKKTYKGPEKTGTLPQVGGDVLASIVVLPKQEGTP